MKKVVVFSFVLILHSITFTQLKNVPFAEAISSNGLKAIIGEIPSMNHTYIVVTIPTKYILKSESIWKKIALNWASDNPTREIVLTPSIEYPILSVICDRENDEGAFYQFIQKMINENWVDTQEKLTAETPSLSWFQLNRKIGLSPPTPTDLTIGVLSNTPIEITWRWMEESTSNWIVKKSLVPDLPLDTTEHNWVIHRFGERVDLILFQPLMNFKVAMILLNETRMKNLQAYFYKAYLLANIPVISIEANVFPPMDPQYLWMKISGTEQEFQTYISNWNVVWQEYLLNTDIPQKVQKNDQILTLYEELEQKCLQKTYPKLFSNRTFEYSMNEVRSMMNDEKWSVLAFVDTTRVKVDEYFRIRKN
ncbi:MAG: hypothetical protein N2450_08825 [bacterium]|nr:hypothetical protein [bacterium]